MRRGALFFLFSILLLATLARAQVAPTSTSDPEWSNSIIAKFQPSMRNGPLDGLDRFRYQLNNDGLIRGDELIKVLHALEANYHGGSPSPEEDAAFAKQAFALVALNRIIDREAMYHKIDPRVPSLRIHYLARFLMIQSAVERDKVPTQTIGGGDSPLPPLKVPNGDLSGYSNQRLYEFLKEPGATNPDAKVWCRWDYAWGGLDGMLAQLQAERPVFPTIFTKLRNLPATEEQFEQTLEKQLRPIYMQLMRKKFWENLKQEKLTAAEQQILATDPSLAVEVASSAAEIHSLYKHLKALEEKEPGAVPVENDMTVFAGDASIYELKVSGPSFTDFIKRFHEEMKKETEAAKGQIFALPDENAIQAKIDELRATVPGRVVDSLKEEFKDAIAQSQLQISFTEKAFKDDVNQPTPLEKYQDQAQDAFYSGKTQPAPSLELIEWNAAFNDFNDFKRGIFPYAQHALDTILIAKKTGTRTLLPEQSRRALKRLVAIIQKKRDAYKDRLAAYRLFQANPFVILRDTCGPAPWACQKTSPDDLINAISSAEPYAPAAPGAAPSRPDASPQLILGVTSVIPRAFDVQDDPR